MLLVACAAGCGDSAPRYTLRQVMFEVEAARKDVERELSRPSGPGGIASAAEQLERWMGDPSLERYLERRDLRGDPALFRTFRGELDAALAPFVAAARAGDPAAAREAYPAVQAACTRCHATFRPELLLPR